ncbi:MAG: efflux RND transporter periplasmic adaptor subunit [Gemmatimonadaceae bacterium]|nr:efflux RND transporter periplasmic adaptor subunit [Gemmatimonadaceae bacterium]
MRHALGLAAAAFVVAACSEVESAEPLRTAVIGARDIVISARAAGTVAPVTTIEVKSQASGEITEVHVEEGEMVRRGQLLARVDPRIPSNAVIQATADSVVAQAALANAESRLERAEQLFAQQALTEEEAEAARLSRATAYADLIRAQRALEDARIAFVQTEVRAPSDGVILSRSVAVGSVIASASRDVGGGAILMRMASLDIVEVRALVDERDIGRIKEGLPVEITVASFPNRPFRGEVLRVGAEAVIEQNVTTFPVIVRIPNADALLKPGMNAEVEIMIGEARDVLAVPVTALRDERDVETVAELVGLSSDSIRAQLRDFPRGAFAAFVRHNGQVRAQAVQMGLTDYDWAAVLDGLVEGDTVVILPTSGLLADQARRAEWIQRRVGGGPLGGG